MLKSQCKIPVYQYISHSKEFAGNQGKHQNWVPSILPHNLWLILIGIKQKKNYAKKKSKMAEF